MRLRRVRQPPGSTPRPITTTTVTPPTRAYNSLGGSLPTGVWLWTAAQLAAYNGPANVNRNPAGTRIDYQLHVRRNEKDYAGYVQADFKGENWAANVGVRYVRTDEHVLIFTQVDPTTPGRDHDLGVRAVHRDPG